MNKYYIFKIKNKIWNVYIINYINKISILNNHQNGQKIQIKINLIEKLNKDYKKLNYNN